MREKIVGIIGGMGPEATVDLMARIIKVTPAVDDGDHIRMIVDNNPKVPSRIKAGNYFVDNSSCAGLLPVRRFETAFKIEDAYSP